MEFIPLCFQLSIIEPILLLNNLYINPFATKSRPKRYSFASPIVSVLQAENVVCKAICFPIFSKVFVYQHYLLYSFFV